MGFALISFGAVFVALAGANNAVLRREAPANVSTDVAQHEENAPHEARHTHNQKIERESVWAERLERHEGKFQGSSSAMLATVPTQKEALAMLTPALFANGSLYKKFGQVFLKKAVAGERVVTIINGQVETNNTVPDEGVFWISRADTTAKERLILPDAKRQKLYKNKTQGGGSVPDEEGFTGPYMPLGRVLAVQATSGLLEKHFPDGKFIAPWNSEMVVEKGDFLVAPVPPEDTGMPEKEKLTEVYRIEKSMFVQTYKSE